MSEALTLLEIADTTPNVGPSWLDARRDGARAKLSAEGLPTKRTEAYRFTSVKALVESRFIRESDATRVDAHKAIDAAVAPSSARIALIDGVPDLTGFSLEGVAVTKLRDALSARPELERWLGANAVDEHFVALNTASFTDGLLIEVEGGVTPARAIELVHIGTRVAQSVQARLVVRIGDRASVTLIESVLGGPETGHFTNIVSEIALGEGARLDHVLVHEDEGQHIARHAVRQSARSTYSAMSAVLTGRLVRIDQHVLLEGEGATASLDGVFVATGEDHVDHHTRVEHRAPRCTSNQRYRGLADDEATAVFDGIVVVAKDAGKTEAHQQSRNLLLSDRATIHTKPHLEIDTDDVVCSHGATVGTLDEEQVFYLRARGIDDTMARAMLTYAFLREIVESVSHEPTQKRIEDALFRALPGGSEIRDFV